METKFSVSGKLKRKEVKKWIENEHKVKKTKNEAGKKWEDNIEQKRGKKRKKEGWEKRKNEDKWIMGKKKKRSTVTKEYGTEKKRTV